MQIRYVLLILFIAFSSLAFSQNTLEQKDSIAKSLTAIEGKSIVYILRPNPYWGALFKLDIICDSIYIGSNRARKYVYIVLPPGKHVFISASGDGYELDLNLEAGKVYYIKQGIEIYPDTKLVVSSEEDGKEYLKKCTLSKDNVYPN
jgi:hypothetical protein